jgi:cytosine/uracil/thiamine/allantoin permease
MAMLGDMESRLSPHRRRHSIGNVIGVVVSMLLVAVSVLIVTAGLIITGAMILLHVDLSQLKNFG